MIRADMITTVGRAYLTSNIENDEYSYPKAFTAASALSERSAPYTTLYPASSTVFLPQEANMTEIEESRQRQSRKLKILFFITFSLKKILGIFDQFIFSFFITMINETITTKVLQNEITD